MPFEAKHLCNRPGCPEVVSTYLCAEHEKERQQAVDKERLQHNKYYKSTAWQKKRKAKLSKYPFCEVMQHDGMPCNAIATEVDHIVPRADGGSDDDHNLQSICHSCHSSKTAREKRSTALRRAEVILVAGPPGGGKTTYVAQHLQKNDIVVDLDAISAALRYTELHDANSEYCLPFAMAARDAILRRLLEPGKVERAWIIEGAPHRARREQLRKQWNAKVIVVETPLIECLKRIRGDKKRDQSALNWYMIVDKWWQAYEKDDRDELLCA